MAKAPKTDTGTPAPDLDDLAKQYMDLWQKQLSALSNDDTVADLMAKTLELMNPGTIQSGQPGQPNMMDPKNNPFLAAFSMTPETNANAGTRTQNRAQDGTKAASPSGGDPDHDVVELTRRIHALEKRIAELETGTEKRSKRAQPKSKKR